MFVSSFPISGVHLPRHQVLADPDGQRVRLDRDYLVQEFPLHLRPRVPGLRLHLRHRGDRGKPGLLPGRVDPGLHGHGHAQSQDHATQGLRSTPASEECHSTAESISFSHSSLI